MNRAVFCLVVMLSLPFVAAPAEARNYPRSERLRVDCSKTDASQGEARATYKVEAKLLIKMAVVNRCAGWVTVWWNSEGTPVYLQIAPSQSFDLWKSELGPLPRKLKTNLRLRTGRYGCGVQCDYLNGRVWRVDASDHPYRVQN